MEKKERLLIRIRAIRKVLMGNKYNLTNKQISEDILNCDERTFSGICTGNRVPKGFSKLHMYIILLESYLQQSKKNNK